MCVDRLLQLVSFVKIPPLEACIQDLLAVESQVADFRAEEQGQQNHPRQGAALRSQASSQLHLLAALG